MTLLIIIRTSTNGTKSVQLRVNYCTTCQQKFIYSKYFKVWLGDLVLLEKVKGPYIM